MTEIITPELAAERLATMHRERVFRYVSGRGLGDCWTLVQWLLRRSEETGRPARLSRHLGPQPDSPSHNVLELIPRIAALLDSPGSIQIVDEEGEDPPVSGPSLWGKDVVYMSTKRRWRWQGHHTICHQWDGRSGADAKNPSPEDVQRIHGVWGNRMFRLGLPLTIEEDVAFLARCALYVGVCSGVSHAAHSVGCPMILLQLRLQIARWHPAESASFEIAHGTDDLLRRMSNRLGAA